MLSTIEGIIIIVLVAAVVFVYFYLLAEVIDQIFFGRK